MRRITGAFREWLQLRSRLYEERRFHIENAAADLRARGLSPRESMRQARSRFGSRRHLKHGFRELGGDIPGLACLLRAHRVPASAWLQPALFLGAIAFILLISPAPRALLEGVIFTPFSSDDRAAVIFQAEGRTPAERAVTSQDFETIRALSTLTEARRYRTFYVQARAARGASLLSIRSELRAKTGNRRLWVGWQFLETKIETGPADVIWILLWFYFPSSLLRSIPSRSSVRGKVNWLLYGLLLAFLHTLLSLMTWALVVQIWRWAPASGVAASAVFSLVFLAYLLISATQCRWWHSDLNQRCPVCLDRLVMPLTEGIQDRVLLESAITESVCAHGHGVLVESRWARRFRPEESPLHGLVRV